MVAAKPAASSRRKRWVPDRQDIIWIDCNPQVGREMRDAHPFLVLSPKIFNEKTSRVIGLPMTTVKRLCRLISFTAAASWARASKPIRGSCLTHGSRALVR